MVPLVLTHSQISFTPALSQPIQSVCQSDSTRPLLEGKNGWEGPRHELQAGALHVPEAEVLGGDEERASLRAEASATDSTRDPLAGDAGAM